jgi:8-oxo-dGTP pyrophosphatase MutT (NUDIX family)
VVLTIGAAPPHDVIFIRRAAHLRDHPGQIGLPGGSVDPADGDDRARTALRELYEETGIPPDRVRIVGALPEVRQRVNTFVVTPLVGIVAPETPVTIDPAETAAYVRVPLAAIVAPGAVHDGVEEFAGLRIATDHFDYGALHVWGLTGRILRTFVDAWRDRSGPLRAAIVTQIEHA